MEVRPIHLQASGDGDERETELIQPVLDEIHGEPREQVGTWKEISCCTENRESRLVPGRRSVAARRTERAGWYLEGD